MCACDCSSVRECLYDTVCVGVHACEQVRESEGVNLSASIMLLCVYDFVREGELGIGVGINNPPLMSHKSLAPYGILIFLLSY